MVTHTHTHTCSLGSSGNKSHRRTEQDTNALLLQADLALGQGRSLAHPWRIDIRVADPRHSSRPCHHGHHTHGHLKQCCRWPGKRVTPRERAHSPLEYESSVLGQ